MAIKIKSVVVWGQGGYLTAKGPQGIFYGHGNALYPDWGQ